MTYELAKQLYDAGYQFKVADKSQRGFYFDESWLTVQNPVAYGEPTLSELIDACGDHFRNLYHATPKPEGVWGASSFENPLEEHIGLTKKEAVAKLWLSLNKKK